MSELSRELEKFAGLKLECDGLTRVLTYHLKKLEVPHMVMVGSARTAERQAKPHWWIELADGRTVDYRARMWLGDDPFIPNGIFRQKDYPNVAYEGEEYPVMVSDMIFNVLTSDTLFA